MTKKLLVMCVLLTWASTLISQNISVVAPDGDTRLYMTLTDAIRNASEGSVIYLSGGGFPIDDSVKITKKLTIIGIGHYLNSGNADGITTISGNLWFNEGSSGSAVWGCYITGTTVIGDGGTSVNDILIRCCNLNSINVKSNNCYGIIINQNFIRTAAFFGNSSTNISNNIIQSVVNVDGGSILNNIITGYYQTYKHKMYGDGGPDNDKYSIIVANNSLISNNIMLAYGRGGTGTGSWTHVSGTNNIVVKNMTERVIGDSCININAESSTITWDSVFVKYNSAGITPVSDFHFKDDFKRYEEQVGIYGGTGFNDKQIAPVPYIVSKYVDEKTDAQGRLNIKIRVRASE